MEQSEEFDIDLENALRPGEIDELESSSVSCQLRYDDGSVMGAGKVEFVLESRAMKIDQPTPIVIPAFGLADLQARGRLVMAATLLRMCEQLDQAEKYARTISLLSPSSGAPTIGYAVFVLEDDLGQMLGKPTFVVPFCEVDSREDVIFYIKTYAAPAIRGFVDADPEEELRLEASFQKLNMEPDVLTLSRRIIEDYVARGR